MKEEIESATKFMVELMRTGSGRKLSEQELESFRKHAITVITLHYEDHWFPEQPIKGSGYRCIRNNGKVDPILARTGQIMGIAAQFLYTLFPHELTMWIDPNEVSYRIGEHGSICILFEAKPHLPPSPPATPPNKKIRSSPEPPATPMKVVPTMNQATTPPQALSYNQHFSPSNSRRASPNQHLQFLQHQHQLALLKEATNSASSNCKDLMRPNHVLPLGERLFVSS